MANYEEARVKLRNTQLSKLKSAAKNNTGKTLRITKKNFQGEELPYELFLTTRQKTKTRNVFANKMPSTDIKLVQLAKIIQSGGFLGKTLGNLGKKVLLDLAVPLAKDVFPKLATIATSSILDKFERKMWTRSRKSRKRIHFI